MIAGAMDGFEPGIDKLCIALMEGIVAREKISGVGSAQKRRAAISDAMVNYLIAIMLDGINWSDAALRPPAALILLIKHQLGPMKGDLYEKYKTHEAQRQLAWSVAQLLEPDEKLSINLLVKMASTRTPISRATAARWLKQKRFLNAILSAKSTLQHLRKDGWPE
jgi:hypothetical protein